MKRRSINRVVTAGMLSALAVAFSFLEGVLPPLPIPGARLGLANTVTMVAIGSVSLPCAVGVTVVKIAFALLRGPMACLMSAVGSALSLVVMAVLHRLFADKLSFVGIGVPGAIAHNVGQWCVAYAMLGEAMWYYAPLLLLLAIPAGCITGLLVNWICVHLKQNPRFWKG